ncbi:MAG: hypothetical protein M1483_02980 [Actinobacteria bacterium]|nr:hypothetical protein [Actinomycetota bacterium]MCL6104588.1 hypothetical protein [Actinomycetota bacterium]
MKEHHCGCYGDNFMIGEMLTMREHHGCKCKCSYGKRDNQGKSHTTVSAEEILAKDRWAKSNDRHTKVSVLEDYQRELEQQIADIADLIQRLTEEQQGETPDDKQK